MRASRRGVALPARLMLLVPGKPVKVALWLMVMLPLCVSVVVLVVMAGAKLTPRAQLVPGAREPPQLGRLFGFALAGGALRVKLGALPPLPPLPALRVMLLSARLANPVLLMKIICAALAVPWAWLPKATLVGLTTMLARGSLMPLPFKLILPLPAKAVVLTLARPLSAPGVNGLKVKLMVQLACGARLLGQLVV